MFVGAIYVFCIWAEMIRLGSDASNKLDGSGTPWNDLANTYAPWMQLFVTLASVSSMFAVMVNSNNGTVRILHVMGREGLLPKFLARIDGRHGTPANAVIAQGVFSVILAFVVGAVSGGLANVNGGSNVYGYHRHLLRDRED